MILFITSNYRVLKVYEVHLVNLVQKVKKDLEVLMANQVKVENQTDQLVATLFTYIYCIIMLYRDNLDLMDKRVAKVDLVQLDPLGLME